MWGGVTFYHRTLWTFPFTTRAPTPTHHGEASMASSMAAATCPTPRTGKEHSTSQVAWWWLSSQVVLWWSLFLFLDRHSYQYLCIISSPTPPHSWPLPGCLLHLHTCPSLLLLPVLPPTLPRLPSSSLSAFPYFMACLLYFLLLSASLLSSLLSSCGCMDWDIGIPWFGMVLFILLFFFNGETYNACFLPTHFLTQQEHPFPFCFWFILCFYLSLSLWRKEGKALVVTVTRTHTHAPTAHAHTLPPALPACTPSACAQNPDRQTGRQAKPSLPTTLFGSREKASPSQGQGPSGHCPIPHPRRRRRREAETHFARTRTHTHTLFTHTHHLSYGEDPVTRLSSSCLPWPGSRACLLYQWSLSSPPSWDSVLVLLSINTSPFPPFPPLPHLCLYNSGLVLALKRKRREDTN